MKSPQKQVHAETAKPPIDPLEGPKLALSGQIVTMDPTRRVLKKGAIFIEQGGIVALCDEGEAAPPGFSGLTN